MRVNEWFGCKSFPCQDVNTSSYLIPQIDIDPETVTIIMISESSPADPNHYYYAAGQPSFQQITVKAFNDAGIKFSSIQDFLELGVYLTTAVKCGKTGYGIQTQTIKECSTILENKLDLFPNVEAYLLMGDVAIKAMNEIARRGGAGRVIPAGSTYKLRGQEYRFRGARAYPSHLQVGPSFNIEKSKRPMIAEDIAAALNMASSI
jgi:uracil-DNA glycosylase